MSESNPYQIVVTCQPFYLEHESNPNEDKYIFAYTINIRNNGMVSVKLLSRHWIITDSHMHIEEVRGPGVIGQQPVIGPNQQFEYSSGCPLRTSVGTMKGEYQMVAEDGTLFEVAIPEFVLTIPRTLH